MVSGKFQRNNLNYKNRKKDIVKNNGISAYDHKEQAAEMSAAHEKRRNGQEPLQLSVKYKYSGHVGHMNKLVL